MRGGEGKSTCGFEFGVIEDRIDDREESLTAILNCCHAFSLFMYIRREGEGRERGKEGEGEGRGEKGDIPDPWLGQSPAVFSTCQ